MAESHKKLSDLHPDEEHALCLVAENEVWKMETKRKVKSWWGGFVAGLVVITAVVAKGRDFVLWLANLLDG